MTIDASSIPKTRTVPESSAKSTLNRGKPLTPLELAMLVHGLKLAVDRPAGTHSAGIAEQAVCGPGDWGKRMDSFWHSIISGGRRPLPALWAVAVLAEPPSWCYDYVSAARDWTLLRGELEHIVSEHRSVVADAPVAIVSEECVARFEAAMDEAATHWQHRWDWRSLVQVSQTTVVSSTCKVYDEYSLMTATRWLQKRLSLEGLFRPAEGAASGKTNLTLSDVCYIGRTGGAATEVDQFLELLVRTGKYTVVQSDWSNAALAGWLLCLLENPLADLIWPLVEAGLTSVTQLEATKWAKSCHTLTRTTRQWFYPVSPLDAIHLQYLDTLFNRSMTYAKDIDSEIYMRMQSGPAQYTPPAQWRAWIALHHGEVQDYPPPDPTRWNEDMAAAFDRVLRRTIPRGKLEISTFSEYWDRRLKWVAGGSAAGYRFDISASGGLFVIRAGKRLALEQLTLDELAEVVQVADPILYSRSALKLECGKTRALWNTAVTHYLISGYVADSVERLLGLGTSPWSVGYTPQLVTMRETLHRMTAAAAERPLYMWDYADFNVNHKLSTQAIMWRQIAAILRYQCPSAEVGADLITCSEWTAEAVLHTIMENQNSGLIAEVRRSLMTGTRGTALTNTLCNAVYREIVGDACRFWLGQDPIVEYYGQGDDVWMELMSDEQAPFMAWIFNMSGYAGQGVKVLVGRGELLRVNYDEAGHMRGYLNRSLASAVAGEFAEGLAVDDPETRSQGISSFVRKLEDRGAAPDLIRGIRTTLLRNKVKATYTDETGVHRVLVDQGRLLAPVWRGGLGLGAVDPYADTGIRLAWPRLAQPAVRVPHALLTQLEGVASAQAVAPLEGCLLPQTVEKVRYGLLQAASQGHLPAPLASRYLAIRARELQEWRGRMHPQRTRVAPPAPTWAHWGWWAGWHLHDALNAQVSRGPEPYGWGAWVSIVFVSHIADQGALTELLTSYDSSRDSPFTWQSFVLWMRSGALLGSAAERAMLLAHWMDDQPTWSRALLWRYTRGDIPLSEVVGASSLSAWNALVRRTAVAEVETHMMETHSAWDVARWQRCVACVEFHAHRSLRSLYEQIYESSD
jgi:hypothetical protein